MVKTILKWIGATLLTLVVVAGAWMAYNWKDIKNLQELNSAWYAQNMCACLFVTERKEPACRAYVRQILPVKSVVVDRKRKRVTATATALALWNTNASQYEGIRHGCRLVKK